jgi:acyl carrier protein
MTQEERRVIATILAVFANKGTKAPPLGPETVLDGSLGLESIDFAELVVRLEAEFDHDPFSLGNTPQIRTVGDLAALYAPPAEEPTHLSACR